MFHQFFLTENFSLLIAFYSPSKVSSVYCLSTFNSHLFIFNISFFINFSLQKTPVHSKLSTLSLLSLLFTVFTVSIQQSLIYLHSLILHQFFNTGNSSLLITLYTLVLSLLSLLSARSLLLAFNRYLFIFIISFFFNFSSVFIDFYSEKTPVYSKLSAVSAQHSTATYLSSLSHFTSIFHHRKLHFTHSFLHSLYCLYCLLSFYRQHSTITYLSSLFHLTSNALEVYVIYVINKVFVKVSYTILLTKLIVFR